MKQHKPDQGPDAVRQQLDRDGITTDTDQIFAFISQALRRPYVPPDQENTQAAAALLFEMIQAARYGKPWEPYKKRVGVKKIQDKAFDPNLVTPTDQAFWIVLAHVRGELDRDKTIAALAEAYHYSEDSAEKWLPIIKKKAEQFDPFKEALNSLPQKK